jgi:uncharacterized phage infection (PIP) family protein YhgE
MGQLKRAIRQVFDMVREIAPASDEQSRGIEQVHQAVNEMDKVTQQNTTLVEQAAVAARSLEEQAIQLKDAVSVFKLSNADPFASRTAVFLVSPVSSPPRKASATNSKPGAAERHTRIDVSAK